VLIQLFLIAATVGLVIILLQRRGAARTRAWKRLILVALAGAAVVSILYPDLTTRVANFVGVGRGTDLLLYALTAVFLYVVVGFYLKFRDVERQLTVLARRTALDEALRRAENDGLPVPPASDGRV
jgi:small membrane protein